MPVTLPWQNGCCTSQMCEGSSCRGNCWPARAASQVEGRRPSATAPDEAALQLPSLDLAWHAVQVGNPLKGLPPQEVPVGVARACLQQPRNLAFNVPLQLRVHRVARVAVLGVEVGEVYRAAKAVVESVPEAGRVGLRRRQAREDAREARRLRERLRHGHEPAGADLIRQRRLRRLGQEAQRGQPLGDALRNEPDVVRAADAAEGHDERVEPGGETDEVGPLRPEEPVLVARSVARLPCTAREEEHRVAAGHQLEEVPGCHWHGAPLGKTTAQAEILPDPNALAPVAARAVFALGAGILNGSLLRLGTILVLQQRLGTLQGGANHGAQLKGQPNKVKEFGLGLAHLSSAGDKLCQGLWEVDGVS
mmetsp:Transcript_56173/g.180295  ORF Transcript_56173/g.180295 Transcript_56173/m.180295 type:complete len:364 (-) Transcript_56173:1839-2930(-)